MQYILFFKVCDDFDTWTVHGSSCYLRDTSYRSWSSAEQRCTSHHPKAHLVIIESDSENDFVASFVGSSTYWIGLTDKDVEGKFHKERAQKHGKKDSTFLFKEERERMVWVMVRSEGWVPRHPKNILF